MKTSIAIGTTRAGLGEMAWRRLSRAAADIRRAYARRKACRALAALDDRTLRDIGIERNDIDSAVDAALAKQSAALRGVHLPAGRRSIAA